jgi:glutamate-5-semialdehyde dehydrogenase
MAIFEGNTVNTSHKHASVEAVLQQSRTAFLQLSVLTTNQKNEALECFATLIETCQQDLLAANQQDVEQARRENLPSQLQARLTLDAGKLKLLVQGIRDLIALPDPAGKVLSRLKLDDGLLLEKETVPLGVIGIIFESRPDVMPQVLSLVLKSGNAVVLKGGQEARHSNQAMYNLVCRLTAQCPFLPAGWAALLNSREAVHEMLAYPQYVDLIIPRGSNQLVQSIMADTKIPVLGHADGVCHTYIHHSANLEKALAIVTDAKTQYPSACNATETLLLDTSVAQSFLTAFVPLCKAEGILLKGCQHTCQMVPDMTPANQADWLTEYGDLILSVKLVNTLEEAILHINTHGSHHTDSIVATDDVAIEHFLKAVDSACVFSNASTRFADGFRFGFGAEIGISTAKTHARGPVGLEGLVIYKYKLRGSGQVVKDYTGDNGKPFLHQSY